MENGITAIDKIVHCIELLHKMNIITITAIALITLNCVLYGLIPFKKLESKNTTNQIIIWANGNKPNWI